MALLSPGYYSGPNRNWGQCLCKYLGENKVYYGRCANGESQFERKWFLWEWLHKILQGQHLPRLSINFVVINKDSEKLPTQLY